jgi:hypothetical protein
MTNRLRSYSEVSNEGAPHPIYVAETAIVGHLLKRTRSRLNRAPGAFQSKSFDRLRWRDTYGRGEGPCLTLNAARSAKRSTSRGSLRCDRAQINISLNLLLAPINSSNAECCD